MARRSRPHQQQPLPLKSLLAILYSCVFIYITTMAYTFYGDSDGKYTMLTWIYALPSLIITFLAFSFIFLSIMMGGLFDAYFQNGGVFNFIGLIINYFSFINDINDMNLLNNNYYRSIKQNIINSLGRFTDNFDSSFFDIAIPIFFCFVLFLLFTFIALCVLPLLSILSIIYIFHESIFINGLCIIYHLILIVPLILFEFITTNNVYIFLISMIYFIIAMKCLFMFAEKEFNYFITEKSIIFGHLSLLSYITNEVNINYFIILLFYWINFGILVYRFSEKEDKEKNIFSRIKTRNGSDSSITMKKNNILYQKYSQILQIFISIFLCPLFIVYHNIYSIFITINSFLCIISTVYQYRSKKTEKGEIKKWKIEGLAVNRGFMHHNSAVYHVQVETNVAFWYISKRYSELRTIHNMIQNRFVTISQQLPEFPMSYNKLLTDHKNTAFIEQRRILLDNYVKKLAEIAAVKESNYVIFLFGNQPDPEGNSFYRWRVHEERCCYLSKEYIVRITTR